MHASWTQSDVRVITIPTNDRAFSRIVDRIFRSTSAATPSALQSRLRRTFPRAVVRARDISGDPAWYVYRDGGWASALSGPWWHEPGLPRLAVNRDGWITEASPTALGLLQMDATELGARHFTDFVVPGTLEDSLALFDVVDQGGELTATVLVRPTSGHMLAVDLHARREGELLVGVMRLADDVGVSGSAEVEADMPEVVCDPETDAAFRGYVDLAMARMPEPTADGLALRLRRLYPHAEVTVGDGQWLARREPSSQRRESDPWWLEQGLPTVTYDAQALIISANDAAQALLGRSLVGHYWQEFVTPGSTEQVSAMLEILAKVGRAESRFRMPRADGSLVEFDSYTEVTGESYMTVIRPRG